MVNNDDERLNDTLLGEGRKPVTNLPLSELLPGPLHLK